MKTTDCSSARFWRAIVTFAAFLGASLSMPAQTVSPPSSSSTTVDEEEDIVYMSPFVVSETEDVGYSSQTTLMGSRSSAKTIDLPASVSIMNSQLIADTNAFDVSQVVSVGVSGVTSNQTINDDFNIRGFRSINSLRNNVRKATFKRNPMYDVERVEVLKGPASLLLADNSFLGGAVNLISLRPTGDPSGRVRATISDNGVARLDANVSGPLIQTDEVDLNYRVTVGGKTGDTDKEIASPEKELFLGGGFEVFFGDDTSFRFNGYWYKDDTYRYWDDFLDISAGAPSADNLMPAVLNQYSTASFSPGRSQDAFWDNTDVFIDMTFLTKLASNLNLRAFYSYNQLTDRRRHVRGITVQEDNFTLNRQDIPLIIDDESQNIQIDLMHSLDMDSFKLDSTVGLDRTWGSRIQYLSVNSGIPALDTRTNTFPDDDEYFSQSLPGAGMPNTIQNGSDPTQFSYYIQENLAVLDDRLILVGGIRGFEPGGFDISGGNYDTGTITQRDTKKFHTTKWGIVYKFQPWLMIYGTQAENVFTAPGGRTDKFEANDQLGEPFQDQKGTLDEIGIKMDHRFSESLSMHGSLVYFDQSLTNVRTFGDLGNGVDGIIQSEEDTATGFEIDYGMRYSTDNGDLDVIFTYFNGDSDTATNPGLQAAGFAQDAISLLGKYTWTEGALSGFMLGASAYDQSELRNGFYLIDQPLIINVFAGYQYGEHWNFQLNLDNVTNERYIVARAADGLIQVAEEFRARFGVSYFW
jgi:outer membrane receptor protein involved in Fe transport